MISCEKKYIYKSNKSIHFLKLFFIKKYLMLPEVNRNYVKIYTQHEQSMKKKATYEILKGNKVITQYKK